jgi:diguanylate cyclase (GGDEF)-like protein
MRLVKAWWDNGFFFVGIGTLMCVLLSLGLNYLLLFSDTLTPFGRSMIVSVAVPVLVSLPLLTWMAFLRGEVAALRRQSMVLASRDRLTGLPDRNAFSSIVDRRKPVTEERTATAGAFLIIRASVSRSSFPKFGLNISDDAINLTAAKIVSTVRSTDVVGRVGPDLFAILLWGASEEHAQDVAHRICEGAGVMHLGQDEDDALIDLYAGGIMFEGQPDVDQLFRQASKDLHMMRNGEGTIPFVHSSTFPMSAVAH